MRFAAKTIRESILCASIITQKALIPINSESGASPRGKRVAIYMISLFAHAKLGDFFEKKSLKKLFKT